MISKGYSCYIYDYKFDDLSTIAYNTLLNNMDKYKVKPKFYVINFDDPRRSHRCNPINPEFMTDISDAYEASYTIMLNLNKTWIEKQGDFFVESPIILLAAIIWYLKIYKNVLSGAGELPFTLYGRLEIRSSGSAPGADCQCKNPAHQNDFTTALLGNDG